MFTFRVRWRRPLNMRGWSWDKAGGPWMMPEAELMQGNRTALTVAKGTWNKPKPREEDQALWEPPPRGKNASVQLPQGSL